MYTFIINLVPNMMKTAVLICLVPGPHSDSKLIITLHEEHCIGLFSVQNDEIRQTF